MGKSKIRDGINLEVSTNAGSVSGDLRNDAGALKFYDGSSEETIATAADISDHADEVTSVHGVTGNVVGTSDTQTITNKTIDADSNTVSNIADAQIKAAAAIDATKIADGSVTSTEFQYLANVTSDIQGQIDAKSSAPSGLTDNTIIRANGTDDIQGSSVVIDDSDNITGIVDLTTTGDVIVGGDLTVNGTTTTINTATLEVEDANITINNGGNQASAAGAGITVEMSDATDAAIVYDSSLTSKFKVGEVASEAEIVTTSMAQVITAKDIDGGTASNTSRITLPKNTTSNLAALTDKEATIAYDTDLNTIVINNGAGWTEVSGGGSGQGETNYSANPYFIEDTTGVSSSSGDLTFALTAVSGEAQYPSISPNSLIVSKAAADCEDAFITLDSITLDPAYQKSGMAVVKLQIDTTVDSNFVNESFKIVVTDPNDSDREVSRAGGTLIQSNSSIEYQVLIDIPSDATELDTRVVCVSSNATAYDFIIGKHVVGELSQASIEGENIYTAVIANNGTATITSQSQTFIASVNRSSLGNVDVTFVSGFFSVVPSVVATKSGSQENIRITSKTTSGFTVTIRNDSGTFFDGNFDLVVGRQGDDFQESNYVTNFELGLQTVSAKASMRTTAQSISNNTFVPLQMDSNDDDEFGCLNSNGQFVAPRSGKLRVSYSAVFAATNYSTGNLAAAQISINGTAAKQTFLWESPTGVTTHFVSPQGTAEITVVKDDVVTVDVYQNTGVARSMVAEATGTNTWVEYRMEPNYSVYNAIEGNQATFGPYALTVTATNWTTERAQGIVRRIGSSTWRLEFNISGTLSSPTTSVDFTIDGIQGQDTYTRQALCAIGATATTSIANAWFRTSTDAIEFRGSSTSAVQLSGSIELAGKPSFV